MLMQMLHPVVIGNLGGGVRGKGDGISGAKHCDMFTSRAHVH